ncbi:hypothetical protein F4781DRAFT_74248 [Annulohypoxylon bovei var. microspora]|nr:hypothetical protein F4781DRAFT_74248 [Annulohypoxylon bovei var. microspora]
MDLTVGSHAGNGDTAVEIVSSAVPQPQITGRKKGTSCARCRRQKIRCDDHVPSCGNCARAGHVCIRTHLSNNPDVVSYINQIEARLRLLEDTLHRVAPEELAKISVPSKLTLDTAGSHVSQALTVDKPRSTEEFGVSLDSPGIGPGAHNLYDAHQQASSSGGTIVNPSTSAQIAPSDALAHEVGLLSLANSRESKYLGPSSCVPFARMIFSTIPQSQGLATSWVTSGAVNSQHAPQPQPFPPDWTSDVDLQHFVDAYFETHHPLHPFIDEDVVFDHLEILYTKRSRALNPQQMPQLSDIESAIAPIYSVQIFLIIALGARILETRLSADFSSDRYLATAQARIGSLGLSLHDSMEGLQIMLLLILSSFYFENGPNAWFLNSTIIASCLDLGFQRRWIESVPEMSPGEYRCMIHRKNIRGAIFWSAYSIDRNLGVILGRPLTLRDEAIDVEFPGEGSLSYRTSTGQNKDAVVIPTSDSPSEDNDPKRPRIDGSQYAAAHYSLRLDRIVAEIKLMLHRVVNTPERFPWPTDLVTWQRRAHASCDDIIDEVFAHLKWKSHRSSTDIITRSLELKYHHNLMLLHRPSPAIPQPTIESWKICYNSAVKTVMIYSDLHRFSKLTNSWLTAHTVFVSGITFVYCLWAQPQIKNETSLETFSRNAAACKTILTFLGKTWSVAADAVEKFDRLFQMTSHTWRVEESSSSTTEAKASELHTSPSLPLQSLSRDDHGCDPTHAISILGNISGTNTNDQYGTNRDRSQYDFEPSSFYMELGDVSAWFDLDWILSMNTGPSGETISYPDP